MSVVRRRQSRLLFSSFEGWSRDGISQDILAGLTLAAITIPEQMATPKLGGFEPQIGFYAFIGATIGFVGLGASRVLTAGADSTITPIFAGTLAALAAGGSTSVGSAAITLALLVGTMLVVAGIFKLGLDRESLVDTGDNRLPGWHCRTYHRFAIAEPFRPRQGRWRSRWPSPSDGCQPFET